MHPLNPPNFYNEKKLKTRMHSSRMRTARFSCHLGGGCLPKRGGGLSAQGGVCLEGCLPRGGVCPKRSAQGGCTQPPPLLVAIYPFVCGR